MKLPEPAHKFGYTSEQIDEICKNLGVKREEFFKDDFIYTACLDPELGLITYARHVENSFYNIQRKRGE